LCNDVAMTLHTKNDNKRRGIAMMLLACMAFSLMDAVMKQLVTDFPAIQVTAMRAISALPIIVAYVHWRGAWATLWRIRWPLHLFRVVLGVLMLTLFAFALKRLPLTEAYTLFYISPLAIAALSIPFLGEKVAKASWIAIVIGLIGVLVVLKPTGSGMVSLAGLAILASALCYACSAITVRLLSRTDSTESMVFWLMFGISLVAGFMAVPSWRPILPEHYGLLVALAITGFIGQLTITEAFKWAPSATVTPFEYSALLWSLSLDLLIWNTLPEVRVFIGAAIIVASGIYLARHEASGIEAEHP
jgi:drug/metabolite transporter (DMT)-like permease